MHVHTQCQDDQCGRNQREGMVGSGRGWSGAVGVAGAVWELAQIRGELVSVLGSGGSNAEWL